jgi:putative intracellular protease/amidase
MTRRHGFASAAAGLLLGIVGCAAPEPRCRIVDPGPAAAAASAAKPGPVLFVLSAAGKQTLANGKQRRTGFFLGELFEAYRAVRGAGFEVSFATTDGRRPVVDPESLREPYWSEHPGWLAEARELVAGTPALRQPMSLQDALAREAELTGLVIPGGQGVMIDLLEDPQMQALLVRFGATSRPVGLICHAPALLARLSPSNNPFAGRRVTSVSPTEELFIETFIMGGRAQVRRIGAALGERGYRHTNAMPGRGFAVRDCNLVTSQNPYSGEVFAASYLAALEDFRSGGRCCCAPSQECGR